MSVHTQLQYMQEKSIELNIHVLLCYNIFACSHRKFFDTFHLEVDSGTWEHSRGRTPGNRQLISLFSCGLIKSLTWEQTTNFFVLNKSPGSSPRSSPTGVLPRIFSPGSINKLFLCFNRNLEIKEINCLCSRECSRESAPACQNSSPYGS